MRASQETQAKTGIRFAKSLDWNLLRTFHEIVQAGGLTKAARRSNRGQPAISMALRRLEELTGATLCKRGPGGFELTEAGRLVAEVCNQIFGSVCGIPNLLGQAAADIHGRIRLQLISNLEHENLNRPIGRFHLDHPNVELFISIATWDVIQRSVIRDEVEIGIAPANHQLAGLSFEALFVESYLPYCGASHELWGNSFHSPGELAGYSFISTGADEPLELTRFRRKWDLGNRVAGLSQHLEETRRMAELGVGICFLPIEFAAQSVAAGRLFPLLDSKNAPASTIYLITNQHAPPHAARDILINYFRDSRV